MPEFYKYAERKVGSQINWAGLGVDMAETLNAEEKIREQKRLSIDEATNKLMEQLAAAPKGEALDGNKFVADYSDNATQSLLIQHRLLKAGRLNPKDYMLYNANLKSGTTQLFNLQTEYQKQFAEKMARAKSNDPKTASQNLELDWAAHLEGFGDLSKSKAIINPATGQVNVGIMEYDKNNILQSTGKIMTVQDVYKGIAQKYDRFDIVGAAKSISDNLGDVVMTTLKEGSLSKSGQLRTLDYALQKPEMQKALSDYVDSYLENPYNISSILTNELKGYENSFSDDGKGNSNGNKIVWHVDKFGNLSTEFTKEQRDAAKEYLKNKAIAAISQKEEIKTFQSAQVDAYNAQTARINASNNEKTVNDTPTSIDPRTIIRKVNFIDANADGKVDINWTNPQREINTLNTNYGVYGYQFALGEDNSILIAKQGAGQNAISVKIPMNSKTMDAIYEYIIQDKLANPKEFERYVQPNNKSIPSNIGSKYRGK